MVHHDTTKGATTPHYEVKQNMTKQNLKQVYSESSHISGPIDSLSSSIFALTASTSASEAPSEYSSMYRLTQNLMKYLGLSKAKSFSSINRSTFSCHSLLNECVRYSAILFSIFRKYLKSITTYNKHQNILKDVMNINDI